MSYQATKRHRETLVHMLRERGHSEIRTVITATGRSGKDTTLGTGTGPSLPGAGLGGTHRKIVADFQSRKEDSV